MADSTPGDAGKQATLTAAYQSTVNQDFSFSETLAVPASDSIEDRTKYLKSLRQAVLQIQDKVNKELTARMEEDNARATGGQTTVAGVDEAKEEENYGEEPQGEDEE